MSDDIQSPPLVYEGLDPAAEPKSTIAEVSEAEGHGSSCWQCDRGWSKAGHAAERLEQRSPRSAPCFAPSSFSIGCGRGPPSMNWWAKKISLMPGVFSKRTQARNSVA